MHIPLYVFEARYRRLVSYCLEEGLEHFIISLHSAKGLDNSQPFYTVGTLIKILDVSENPDGTYELMGYGQEKCQISVVKQERHAEPDGNERILYFSEKQELPLKRDDPNAEVLAAWDALEGFKRYAKVFFPKETFLKIDELVPEDLLLQASFIAANIRILADDRQRLLEASSLTNRFMLTQAFMEEHLAAHKPPKDL